MKTGLFFGTFNPIHVGHLIIANYMANYTDLDEVWLVVTPQNPLKSKASMLADHHRLALVRIAVEDNEKLKVSNIEFEFPRPSYTVHTLIYLKEKFPGKDFVLIMGEDNLRTFKKWKNYQQILEQNEIYVYPRLLYDKEIKANQAEPELLSHPGVKLFDVPLMKISATFIRKAIRDGKDVHYLLTEPVYKYVMEMHFYEK